MAGAAGPYPLFEAFAGLERRLPRLNLGAWPTPLSPAPGLAAAAGLPWKLYVKRDDLSSPVYGGNKVRKFEFLLARAKAAGRDLVVTAGGLGSNHVVAMAALAPAAGMQARGLLFCQPVTPHVRRNLLAGVALGADLRWVRDYTGVVRGYAGAVAEGLAGGRRTPYLVMPGGSSALSGAGYVSAVFEIAGQLRAMGEPDPAAIVLPAGTGGTAAGVLAGVALGGLDTTVVAVRVVSPGVLGERKVRNLAAATLRLLLRLDPDAARRVGSAGGLIALAGPGARGRLVLEGGFLGEAYGFATEEARRAVALALEGEGLKLETTYTGKALAAMLAAAGSGPAAGGHERWLKRAAAGHPVVFLNTYSSVDPAGMAVGAEPTDLVARVPRELRWCFDRSRRDCACGLARQCRSFCEVVRKDSGWEWRE
ncbi:MAG: pyridoxal-phosphate dependent enzyme [Bacillota bacterium]|nr:MAG: pyridoxal-phosphate dependent enzyme [Bacillota bacterium]